MTTPEHDLEQLLLAVFIVVEYCEVVLEDEASMGPCGMREDHFVGKRVRIVLVCPTLKQASQLGTIALKNTTRP